MQECLSSASVQSISISQVYSTIIHTCARSRIVLGRAPTGAIIPDGGLRPSAAVASAMARSLSSHFLSHPPLPHPNLTLTFPKPHRTSLQLTAQVSQTPPPPSPSPPPTPPPDKKSFSVAVGEVFLGMTSILMNRGRRLRRGCWTGRRKSPSDGSGSVLFGDDFEDEAEGEDGDDGVRSGVGGDEVVCGAEAGGRGGGEEEEALDQPRV